jgi:predicted metal-dependent phosphoesterase TrpH
MLTGSVRVDCHLHTVASGDAVTTLGELAERAAAARIDVVAITDHNETRAAIEAAAAWTGPVRVIVGEEIRTQAGEVIGLFLTERIPYVLPVADAVARIRAQGGLVYLPHPFDPLAVASARPPAGCAPVAWPTSSRCSTPRSPIRT